MSKGPHEWRDFFKKFDDLSTNNYPTLTKEKQVQDTVKFKFSSKAQEGIKFDSSVTNYDASTTDADFSTKVKLEEVKGLELGLKAKSKPSTEFTAKLSDDLFPLAGASFTAKLASSASEQTIGGSFGYANKLVNLNLGFSYPVHHKLFEFVKLDEVAKQQPKVDVDFVAKPLEDKDVYVGGNASIALVKENLTYTSKFAVALNNSTFNGGAFVEHEKKKGT